MTTTEIILLFVAVAAIAAAAWLLWDRQRSGRLKRRFGPEYDRTVAEQRSPRRAEAVLEKREKRVARFHIHRLSRTEADTLVSKWKITQERFVDEPRSAVMEADKLITEAMRTQGYPVADFDQNAADLSVDHPHVVSHYRTAHEIASRGQRASTEELREAMLHYRQLFEEIIGSTETEEVRHHG